MSFARRIYARTVYYPTLLYNMLLGRWLHCWNWWDVVDETLVLGAKPFARDVQALYDLGVRSVINTCEEYAGPVRQYAAKGIEQLHVPTIDFTPPSLDSVIDSVDYIDRQKSKGKVYVHCKAGRARSATIAICWLMKQHGITPKEAESMLRKKRRQILRNLADRQVVVDYWQKFVKS